MEVLLRASICFTPCFRQKNGPTEGQDCLVEIIVHQSADTKYIKTMQLTYSPDSWTVGQLK